LNSNNTVACPLDCFDACEAIYKDNKCKPSREHTITNGKLCVKFAHLMKEENLTNASHDGVDIPLNSALEILTEKLKESQNSKVLYTKGAGNIGVMQGTPKAFFSKYGATFTQGGICDEIGDAGLTQGRGHNVNPPLQNLIDADIIICWGRNFSITSPHMYEKVKNKTFITIDPIQTDMAKKSDLHLQINPKTDHELALLLTRFAYMDDMDDESSYSQYATGADWFVDLAKSRPLVSYEATTGVKLSKVVKFMELIKDKKVAIMLGLGVQKYYEGAQIIRAIDSFAAYIGVHNKSAGGVWYLADAAYGYEKQFETKAKNYVDITNVDFSSYELVFIQGANPVVSIPNSKNVIEGLKNTFVVYFGTTYNDTCEYANLIIPSCDFLRKQDVRLSYGHENKAISYAVREKMENTLSEYELSNFLLNKFDYEVLKAEEEIFDYYKNTRPILPKIESFEFIEELDIEALYEKIKQNQFYLITSKRKNSLNSQFKVDNNVYLHPLSGYEEKQEVILKTEYGEANFEVKLSEDIKENCILIHAGAKKGNYLTPLKSDEVASSAIFQDVIVSIELP